MSPAIREIGARSATVATPAWKPLPKGVLEVVLHPERHDPMGTLVGELLLRIAEARNLQLVAHVHDAIGPVALGFMRQGVIRPTAFIQVISSAGPIQVEEKDGWMTVRCTDPVDALEDRIPRNALGAFLRSAHRDQRVTFEAAGRLALAANDTQARLFPLVSVQWLIGELSSPLASLDLLRLWASLDQQQRQQLQLATELRLSELSEQQAAWLERAWFNQQGSIQPATPLMSPEEAKDLWKRDLSDPTEALAGELPASTRIRIEDQTRACVYVTGTTGDGHTYETAMDLNALAVHLIQREEPESHPDDARAVYENARLGSQRSIDFGVKPNDRFGLYATLREQTKPRGAGVPLDLLLASLPPDVKDELDRWLTTVRKGRKQRPPPAEQVPAQPARQMQPSP